MESRCRLKNKSEQGTLTSLAAPSRTFNRQRNMTRRPADKICTASWTATCPQSQCRKYGKDNMRRSEERMVFRHVELQGKRGVHTHTHKQAKTKVEGEHRKQGAMSFGTKQSSCTNSHALHNSRCTQIHHVPASPFAHLGLARKLDQPRERRTESGYRPARFWIALTLGHAIVVREGNEDVQQSIQQLIRLTHANQTPNNKSQAHDGIWIRLSKTSEDGCHTTLGSPAGEARTRARCFAQQATTNEIHSARKRESGLHRNQSTDILPGYHFRLGILHSGDLALLGVP